MSEGWRRVHADRTTGQVTDYTYDEDNDRCVLRYRQDVEPLLDDNKRLSTEWDGWTSKARDARLAARIPITVAYEWFNKFGVKAWDRNHLPGVKRLLNSNEYRYLRIGHFIV
jgi:hypothetical protein